MNQRHTEETPGKGEDRVESRQPLLTTDRHACTYSVQQAAAVAVVAAESSEWFLRNHQILFEYSDVISYLPMVLYFVR